MQSNNHFRSYLDGLNVKHIKLGLTTNKDIRDYTNNYVNRFKNGDESDLLPIFEGVVTFLFSVFSRRPNSFVGFLPEEFIADIYLDLPRAIELYDSSYGVSFHLYLLRRTNGRLLNKYNKNLKYDSRFDYGE